MDREFAQKIEPIKMQLKCPDHLSWVNDEDARLCRARDVGLDTYIECLEERRYSACKFNTPFANIHLCQCPPRVFLLKEVGK